MPTATRRWHTRAMASLWDEQSSTPGFDIIAIDIVHIARKKQQVYLPEPFREIVN